MRVESHDAKGISQQLFLALLRGLAYRLYSLYYQIKSIKSQLEVCCDTIPVII